MNDTSLMDLEKEKVELLKKYELDEKSIKKFRSKIKKVSEEEKSKLGKEMFELISDKNFKDNYEKVIEYIYNGANIEYIDDKKGDFCLLVCSRKKYLKTALVLLRAGANPNQANNYLTTSIMAGARHGFKELLVILDLLGGDINARCKDGDSAIMSAKKHNHVECFEYLKHRNAYLNNRNLIHQSVKDISSSATFDLSGLSEVYNQIDEPLTAEKIQEELKEAGKKLEKLKQQKIR